MKAAILQCDQVLEKFQAEYGSYSGMVKNLFDAIEEPVEFDIFDCQQGEYPTDIDAYDFYVTTGSKVSVYDDLDWIEPLVEFVKQLDSKQKKLIGICFGHQIIALALGAKVNKSDKGWGIGIAQNTVHQCPKWMSKTKEVLNIIVSHQDQVEDKPEQAEIIAATEFCPNFMLQWNTYFLSIQGHPEWSNDYSRTLITDRQGIIPAERVKTGLESLSIKSDSVLFTQWMIDFAKHTI